MAGQNLSRVDLEAESASNLITTNGLKENDATRVRQADANASASAPNFEDDNLETKTGGGLGSTIEGTQTDPLEFAYIKTLNDAVGNTLEFYVNSDDVTSGGLTVRGFIIASDQEITTNLTFAYYQVSLDGVVWVDPVGVNSDLADLNTWILANITIETFYIRSYATFSGTGEAIINFKYA